MDVSRNKIYENLSFEFFYRFLEVVLLLRPYKI
jgi:hypothetical protein